MAADRQSIPAGQELRSAGELILLIDLIPGPDGRLGYYPTNLG